jgi:hypothetical protein
MKVEIDPNTNEPVWLLPFDYMELGQSFFIPTMHPDRIIAVMYSRAKLAKVKIIAKRDVTEGIMGVRVWLTN